MDDMSKFGAASRSAQNEIVQVPIEQVCQILLEELAELAETSSTSHRELRRVSLGEESVGGSTDVVVDHQGLLTGSFGSSAQNTISRVSYTWAELAYEARCAMILRRGKRTMQGTRNEYGVDDSPRLRLRREIRKLAEESARRVSIEKV